MEQTGPLGGAHARLSSLEGASRRLWLCVITDAMLRMAPGPMSRQGRQQRPTVAAGAACMAHWTLAASALQSGHCHCSFAVC